MVHFYLYKNLFQSTLLFTSTYKQKIEREHLLFKNTQYYVLHSTKKYTYLCFIIKLFKS